MDSFSGFSDFDTALIATDRSLFNRRSSTILPHHKLTAAEIPYVAFCLPPAIARFRDQGLLFRSRIAFQRRFYVDIWIDTFAHRSMTKGISVHMPISPCRATTIVALTLLLVACGPETSAATISIPTSAATALPTAAPTIAPSVVPVATAAPTVVPVLAKDVTVAGIALGGLDLDAARTKLSGNLVAAPLDLHAGAVALLVKPDQIDLVPDFEALITAAAQAKAGDKLPLAWHYDPAKLRALLETTAGSISTPGSGVGVISDTEAISSSFVLRAAQHLDVDAALDAVSTHLASPDYTTPLTLELALNQSGDARPTPEDLQRELDAMAKRFGGVVGVYVHDVQRDKELASVNKGTAFSTASTIKVAIMTSAYAHVAAFNATQTKALERMIINSDNLKANDVLAAGAGGASTEAAFAGAALMSSMLADLGLPTTYQYTPFEANDFIKLYKPKYQTGPKVAGEKPYTDSSRVQRTTPYEMAQLYRFIEQCAHGTGILTEKFPETMTAKRCGEMVALLKRNADTSRMVSGLPKAADVAHKSGWAQPAFQGDAGIVHSPGGDFIIAVYIYQRGEKYSDKFVQQLVGNFTRLAYTYYNPPTVSAK